MSKKFQYAQKTVPQLFLNTWATIKICPIFFAEVTQVSCADTNDKKQLKCRQNVIYSQPSIYRASITVYSI